MVYKDNIHMLWVIVYRVLIQFSLNPSIILQLFLDIVADPFHHSDAWEG